MSGTVIRVKRRLEDNPVEALILSYKRRKTTNESEVPSNDAQQTLLTFAATVPEKDIETVRKALHNAKSKEELIDTFKLPSIDTVNKKRRASLNRRKESRFKVLSCNRSIETVAESDEAITIVDVGVEDSVQQEIVNDAPMFEPKYVYDLYSTDFMPEEADFDDGYLESLVSVEPFRSPMEYRGSEDSEEIDPYEDDSNEECNWRNDYPDSDHSVNEDDMRLAAGLFGMGIDDGVDLSSDSEDERYLAETGESPPRGFEAYKQRILREQNRGNFISVVESDQSDDCEGDESASERSDDSS